MSEIAPIHTTDDNPWLFLLAGKKLSFILATYYSHFNVEEGIHVSKLVDNCVLDKTYMKILAFGDSEEITNNAFRIVGKGT